MDKRLAAAIALLRSSAKAAWKSLLALSNCPAEAGAVTRAAADSMIMFSSLYGGMPSGIGRPGLFAPVLTASA